MVSRRLKELIQNLIGAAASVARIGEFPPKMRSEILRDMRRAEARIYTYFQGRRGKLRPLRIFDEAEVLHEVQVGVHGSGGPVPDAGLREPRLPGTA